MNKKELIKSVAKEAGLTNNQASTAVNAAFNIISQTLAAGDKVHLPGFGTFEVKHREARTGINPRTKEKVEIAACDIPAFKPAKALKESF